MKNLSSLGMLKIATLVLLTATTNSSGGPLLDKAMEMTGTAVEMAGDTADSVVDVVDGKEAPAENRAVIDNMADEALQKLFNEVPQAREQFEAAPAYAVFDARESSMMLTTGFGSGVAIDNVSQKRVYMKMATGGVNVGMGVQFFQEIFLFPTQAAYQDFVTHGWDAGAGANLASGDDADDSENIALRLSDGTIVYKLNDKGIMLNAALTGTKYWAWDELNR